jgi:hypothetical protein
MLGRKAEADLSEYHSINSQRPLERFSGSVIWMQMFMEMRRGVQA